VEATAALRADGTVRAWGSGGYGQAGDGNSAPFVLAPVQVAGLTGANQIAAGEASSYAVAGGRLWAWGGNYFGQLGDGTQDDRAVAAPVAGLDGIVQAACGYSQAAVVRSDGTLWTWGANFAGAQGTREDAPFTTRPAKVPGPAGVTQVSLGFSFDLALVVSN
jgi:alpha-tubulin suppressor-like RCC1 family protein